MTRYPTTWREVRCPCGKGLIPGALYEAGKRTCGNEDASPSSAPLVMSPFVRRALASELPAKVVQ